MYIEQIPNQTKSVIATHGGLLHWQKRYSEVHTLLQSNNVRRVLDIGCNEAKFIQRLTRSSRFSLLVGLDLDSDLLSTTSTLNIAPEAIQDNILYDRDEPLLVKLYEGDATIPYSNIKSQGFDAITLIEVIQHIPIERVTDLNECLFNYYDIDLIIMTTPNSEFNFYFGDERRMRHWDHKFEWTRGEFQQYCEGVKEKYQYDYELFGVGEHVTEKLNKGPCSQGAIFRRRKQANSNTIQATNTAHLIKQQRYPFWKDSYKNHLKNLVIERCFNLQIDDQQTYFPLEQIINSKRIESILKKSKTSIEQLPLFLKTDYLIFNEEGKVRYNRQDPNEYSQMDQE